MAYQAPSFRFGDFAWLCDRASLTVCPALGLGDPQCYSRNVGINSLLIFQPSVFAVDVAALLMTTIMILNIKNKYTAVGRKEMVIFFYLYMLCVMFELLLTTNIFPMSTVFYKYAAAGHVAAITSAVVTLFMNGFIGFQWTEDGTKTSVWTFRITALVAAGVAYFIAISTFMGFAGMSPRSPMILYIWMFIFNGAILVLYVALQIFLVLSTLRDRWPLGDIFFGVLFFGLGLTSIFALSNQVCRFAVHYIDGMFLGSTFILLSVMMVYKFWDSLTSEDLEFSVGGVPQIWHLQNTMDLPTKMME